MKPFFKNIILIPVAIFTLLMSMGIHVTKIQCDKGESVFIGTDVSTCKMQEEWVIIWSPCADNEPGFMQEVLKCLNELE